MKKYLRSLLLAACMLQTAAAMAQAVEATAPLTASERASLTPSREQIELGRSVAEKACAECHGMDGVAGEADQPNLAAQRSVYLHRVLQAYQARNRHSDVMNHATGFLNEEALLAVSAFYASLPPAPLAPVDEEDSGSVTDRGDAFAGIRDNLKKCVKCHGEDGNSSASGMPNLTAQSPEYFVTSMGAYAAKERNHRLMTRLVGDLDEHTIAMMGVYYAVQLPSGSDTTGDGNADKGKLLAEPCAACHGSDGNASGADMPTLAGQDARYFVKAMKAYQDGSRHHEKMFEAVEKLNEEDMADLAAWYVQQEPLRRNVRAPLTTGEWIARCERCHGIDGNSTDPRFPMLAGQNEHYLTTALQAYADGGRRSTTMHAMSEPLTASDIEEIARHYAGQTPKAVVYLQLPCEDTVEE